MAQAEKEIAEQTAERRMGGRRMIIHVQMCGRMVFILPHHVPCPRLAGALAPFPLAKDLRLTHFRAMESHELLREVFDQKGAKEVSADLELSTSMIYKWAQPPNPPGGIENPLDRIEALLRSTGDVRIAQWVCQRAGGFFIANPKRAPHPHQLIPATNQIVQDFADLLHTIALATADEQVTPAEAKQIRARWEELKSVTEGFVAAAESGDFAALKEPELTQRRKDAKKQVGI